MSIIMHLFGSVVKKPANSVSKVLMQGCEMYGSPLLSS